MAKKTNSNSNSNSMETLGFEITGNRVTVEFKTNEWTFTKVYLILEEVEKVTQLLSLQATDFIFNSLKKLSDAGLVADRKSLEEELGL